MTATENALPYSWTEPDPSQPGQLVGNSGQVSLLSPSAEADERTPIVLLLHGLSGDRFHFSTPRDSPSFLGQLCVDHTTAWPAAKDHGRRGYPNLGFWQIEADKPIDPQGYKGYLADQGYRTVNYAQVDPEGLLERPVLEATAILRALHEAFPEAPLHVVAHSRGGLLARRTLMDLHLPTGKVPARAQADAALLRQVRTLVTIASPHQGSGTGALVVMLHDVLTPFRFLPGVSLLLFLVAWLLAFVVKPGFRELTPGSAFLTRMAADEAAQAPALYTKVAAHTIGTSSTKSLRVHFYAFDLTSMLVDSLGMYHWTSTHSELRLLDGVVIPGLAAASDGQGDLLVEEASARLPVVTSGTGMRGSHRSFAVNHADAIHVQPIKDHVLKLLGGPIRPFTMVATPGWTRLEAGRSRTVTLRVTVANTGTGSWPAGSWNLSTARPGWGATLHTPLPALGPGASHVVDLSFTTPSWAGTYQLHHQVSGPGQATGPQATSTLTVPDPACDAIAEELAAIDAALKAASAGEHAEILMLTRERIRLVKRRAALKCR